MSYAQRYVLVFFLHLSLLGACPTSSELAPDAGTDSHDAGTLIDAGAACASDAHFEGGTCVSNTRACVVENGEGIASFQEGNWQSCVIVRCDENHSQRNGACVADRRSCSVDNGEGEQTWLGNEWSVCTAQACDSEYHLEQMVCVYDVRPCEVTQGTGTQMWSNGTWGACTIASCIAGYREENNECVPETRACQVSNGLGEQRWESDAWGPCIPVSCNTGYHEEEGACESDIRICTLANGNGQQTWAGDSWGGCLTTDTCASGYKLNDDGECVSAAGSYIEGPSNMLFAVIPKGTFTMGSPENEFGRDADETQHEVTFTYTFVMGVTEVTQGQWASKTSGLIPPIYPTCGSNCPVGFVDWYSTLAFANLHPCGESPKRHPV